MSRTPKGLRLAAALRAARESRGLTLRELGERTGRNSGVVSRYETADRTPKPEDVAQLLTALEIRGEQYDEILALAYDTDAPGWVAWTLPDQRQQLVAMVDAEQSAARIDHVSPSLFPGILQAESYMTAIMSGSDIPPDEIARRVEIRLGRRHALTKPHPVELMSFIGEAALYWMVGGRAVLADQLRHVLGMMRRPNVQVRVVPFRSGWQPSLEGQFMVIDRAIVHMETRKSGIFLHNRSDVASYLDAVDIVRRVACGEAESKALLGGRLRELEGTAP
ncbi:MAG TPA: helix-turn-helix transcriptional regulator [Pseudonocardiaceae bacterium]|nr:helix-turn-helix transcriptional regulator [Pseudonocardiaceae bacterium]